MRTPSTYLSPPTVIICPGNGCTNIRRSNWYGHLYDSLREQGVNAVCENFPDPYEAKRRIWIPFIESLVGEHAAVGKGDGGGSSGSDSDNVILVGHSSGAQAALRYAETHRLRAAILVAATYGDLNDEGERRSGYYPQPRRREDMGRLGSGSGDEGYGDDVDDGGEETNPYDFDAMKSNCPTWIQFHSNDDPFIPLSEAEKIRDGLELSSENGTYRMLPGRSHFFEPFPELMEALSSLCGDAA